MDIIKQYQLYAADACTGKDDKYEEIIINEEEDKSILYFNTKINSYEDFLRFIFNYYKNLGLPYLTWLFNNKKED